jgi:hypothetical protein
MSVRRCIIETPRLALCGRFAKRRLETTDPDDARQAKDELVTAAADAADASHISPFEATSAAAAVGRVVSSWARPVFPVLLLAVLALPARLAVLGDLLPAVPTESAPQLLHVVCGLPIYSPM